MLHKLEEAIRNVDETLALTNRSMRSPKTISSMKKLYRLSMTSKPLTLDHIGYRLEIGETVNLILPNTINLNLTVRYGM